MVENIKSIIISRTDNLGDVVLSLPICGILKAKFPDCKISFIGKSYTKPLILCSKYVDKFLDREDIIAGKIKLKADAIVYIFPDKAMAIAALKAGINNRIGTSHRWFHWLTCNRLVNFTRKNSVLHESQLNAKLLKPLGINQEFTLAELGNLYGIENENHYSKSEKQKLIFHPKSNGSAREWKLENYFQLAQIIDHTKYDIFVTGTAAEGDKIKAEMPDFFEKSNAIDMTGKFSLTELIAFIKKANALIACSTGPLHIASAFGIHAIGFFPAIKPMHAGRWQPIGNKVKVFALDNNCSDCKNDSICACINSISANEVKNYIDTTN